MNPYDPSSAEYDAWNEGYEAAEANLPQNCPYITASMRFAWFSGWDTYKPR